MHKANRLRHIVSLLDFLPPVIGTVDVSEGASYLSPLGRLICFLRLLPTVGQWSERIEGVATLSAAVESVVVRGAAAILGGCLTSSVLPGFKFELPA